MITRKLSKISLIAFIITLLSTQANAQNERKFIRQGNKIYEQALSDTTKIDTAAFSLAETEYRKALDKRPDDQQWDFNLGNSLYKQLQFDQSTSTFERIAEENTDPIEKSKAYYNLGNSLLMQNKLDESIEAYKNALRQNPNDLESKYNLIYAMNLKKQQEEQQQQQQQNKDQDQQDQNQQQQQNQNQQQQQQNQNQQQNQPPKEQKISEEQAERLLQALQNKEEEIQEKVKEEQAQQVQQRQIDKDW